MWPTSTQFPTVVYVSVCCGAVVSGVLVVATSVFCIWLMIAPAVVIPPSLLVRIADGGVDIH